MHDERGPALIETNHRRLVRAATRLVGTAEAEDAVQDAYLRALEADALVIGAAQAWLLTVVRNLAIDRLRRRRWMQQWLAQTHVGDLAQTSPSAETDVALAQAAEHALRRLAARLSPADGAAVLLHEVFEVGHAEIARASGRTEAGSRQQLRRALLRLRHAADATEHEPEAAPVRETALRLYLRSLQQRDPQTLWAMLRQPPVTASAATPTVAATAAASAVPTTACSVMQVGGQLGLVLTLDGVTLCVVPLDVQPEHAAEAAR